MKKNPSNLTLLKVWKVTHLASFFIAGVALVGYLGLVAGSVFVGAETRAFEAKENELLSLITEHEEEYIAVLQTITKESALERGFVIDSPTHFIHLTTPSVALRYE